MGHYLFRLTGDVPSAAELRLDDETPLSAYVLYLREHEALRDSVVGMRHLIDEWSGTLCTVHLFDGKETTAAEHEREVLNGRALAQRESGLVVVSTQPRFEVDAHRAIAERLGIRISDLPGLVLYSAGLFKDPGGGTNDHVYCPLPFDPKTEDPAARRRHLEAIFDALRAQDAAFRDLATRGRRARGGERAALQAELVSVVEGALRRAKVRLVVHRCLERLSDLIVAAAAKVIGG